MSDDPYEYIPNFQVETYYYLTLHDANEDTVMDFIDKIDPDEDRDLLTLIFKKTPYMRCKVKAGKILY